MYNSNVASLFQGDMSSKDIVDQAFNILENKFLDRDKVIVNFNSITFVSVHFLERLELAIQKANELSIQFQITNISPNIYKVFQVSKSKRILGICV